MAATKRHWSSRRSILRKRSQKKRASVFDLEQPRVRVIASTRFSLYVSVTPSEAAEFRSKYEDAVKENAQYLTTPKPTATETQTPDETAEVEEKSEEEKKDDDGVDQLTKEMEEKATVEGEEAPAESDKKE